MFFNVLAVVWTSTTFLLLSREHGSHIVLALRGSCKANNEPKKLGIWAGERFCLICTPFIVDRARQAAELHDLLSKHLDSNLAKRELHDNGLQKF